MSNNNNPLADLIKDSMPTLIAGALVVARILPSLFEKNPSLKKEKMNRAGNDIMTAVNEIGKMNQKYSDRINNAKNK